MRRLSALILAVGWLAGCGPAIEDIDGPQASTVPETPQTTIDTSAAGAPGVKGKGIEGFERFDLTLPAPMTNQDPIPLATGPVPQLTGVSGRSVPGR